MKQIFTTLTAISVALKLEMKGRIITFPVIPATEMWNMKEMTIITVDTREMIKR